MKITPSHFKKTITEEVQKVINEGSTTVDPELALINNQLKCDPDLANKVLASMVSGLKYENAVEVIKMLSEKMPFKFNEVLLKLRK